MKDILVLSVFAITILAGCKPKSKNSLEIKTDSSKVNNDLKDAKTSGTWSKAYRDKFVQTCISKAAEKVTAADAFAYCNCMTEKVEAKYPNETEVDAKLTSADIESMRPGCATTNTTQTNPSDNTNNTSGAWSASDQREFMDNCTPGASKTLGDKANAYCDCMMRKLMQEYPNSANVGDVSKTHMSELAADCLK